jgi:hypothetical protein
MHLGLIRRAGANADRITEVAMTLCMAPRLPQPQPRAYPFGCKSAAGDQDCGPSTTCDVHGESLENELMPSSMFCLVVPADRT